MQKKYNKINCTGCGACYNICPQNAVKMVYNDYGFYVPEIDKEKCVNCGLCEKICPLDSYKSENFENPKVYAFQNNDEEILYKCASGGAFAKLANNIIQQNGIVYGVIYNENMKVCHSRCDNLTDLEKMYSSKYVQSDTKLTFKQAKKDLENGKLVLFSGTPCQIAGLKSYLQKDYDNLITVDLVCHGVPSPLVFEKYKQEIKKDFKENEKLLNIDFRSKVNGWKNLLYTTVKTNFKEISYSMCQDNFMQLFLSNLSINTSCLSCQFNRLPRMADITIGDFWGVDEYDKDLNDNKGLSIILINSEKGQNIYDKYLENGSIKELPLDFVIKYNPNIVKSSIPHSKRDIFFKNFMSGKDLSYCEKKYLKKNTPIYIKLASKLPVPVKKIIKKILNIK